MTESEYIASDFETGAQELDFEWDMVDAVIVTGTVIEPITIDFDIQKLEKQHIIDLVEYHRIPSELFGD